MSPRVLIAGADAKAVADALTRLGVEVTVRSDAPELEYPGHDLVVFAPGPGEGLAGKRASRFAVLVPPGDDPCAWLAAGALDAANCPQELALRLRARLQAEPREAAATPAPRAVPRLLVIEDDVDLRQLLALVLSAYDVLMAGDGVEGLAMARAERPDLVLTDLCLPRLDGFGVIRALAADPRASDTPVIIVSTFCADLLKARGLELGAVDFLAKPFSPTELVARVERSLRLARQKHALAEMAQTDALTGMPNYRALIARLDQELKRARRYGASVACLMADLDHFKQINDSHGHETGNRALVAFARALRASLRDTDFAARFGGDEFVVLLPYAGEEEAARTAERVRQEVARTFAESGAFRIGLQASFGAAATHRGEQSAEALLAAADAALRAAKRAGRGTVAQHTAAEGRTAGAG